MPGDEVVEDEVVQHDDAGPPAQRVDDPAVRVRIVADVVERDVGVRDGRRAARPHDLDLDEPLERRAAAARSSRRCPIVSGGSGEKYATFMRPPRAGARCTRPT